MLVFGDDGILWVFGAKSEIDDFKIEEDKCLISMTLDKTTNQFTIINLSVYLNIIRPMFLSLFPVTTIVQKFTFA